MKKTITALSISLLALSTNIQAKTTKGEDIMLTQKEKAVQLIQSLETGDRTAVSYIKPQKYIQHNLNVADGLDGFGEVVKHLPKGQTKANVIRSFQDGNYAVVHTEYNFFGEKAGFDIFRFENDLIVEHWDNLQERVNSSSLIF